MFSNQNLALNGAPITNMTVGMFPKENLIAAQQGYMDASILTSSFLQLDPNKNMLLLQTAWDKQVERKESFANSVYRNVVASNAVLTVNGQDGGFKYKSAVETDNCLRTVEDTSEQSPDGYVGVGGSTFKMVLNKKLSPYQTITIDKTLPNSFIMVADVEVDYVGYGYVHTMFLPNSESDTSLAYPISYLKNDVTYQVGSASYIFEYAEKLGIVHLPESNRYLEGEFKLGTGQGMESAVTGKADSYKMNPGYTTVDTQEYIKKVQAMQLDPDNPLVGVQVATPNGAVNTIADLMEILTIKTFNDKFNSSLMFMDAAKISTSKGVIEINEGLWQQMMRGKKFKYNRKGMFDESDVLGVKNYVYKYNNKRSEDCRLKIVAGSELTANIERIIAKHANAQLNNLAPILGSDRPFSQHPVTGALDALFVQPVRFAKAWLPGIGVLEVEEDSSLDNVGGADVRVRGINPAGKDYTAYSGYIWDVTDQEFSNNAELPEGTKAIGGETMVKHNVYLIRPERNAVMWGRQNGRYSSTKVSDIVSSHNLMAQGFWIYGFGALWMPDPSKFVMIELANRFGAIR
jgi:hypothetical protein